MKYFKKIYIFLYYLFILGVLFSQNYYADNNVQFFKSLYNNNNSNLDCDDSDLNIDGIVDIFDIYIILNCILSNDCIECVDINQDYYVNVIDIIIIIDIINNPVVTVEDIDGNILRLAKIDTSYYSIHKVSTVLNYDQIYKITIESFGNGLTKIYLDNILKMTRTLTDYLDGSIGLRTWNSKTTYYF